MTMRGPMMSAPAASFSAPAPAAGFRGSWGAPRASWTSWPWTPVDAHWGNFAGNFEFGPQHPNPGNVVAAAPGPAAQAGFGSGAYGGWSAGAPTCAWWLDAECAPWDYWGMCPNIFVGGSCCSGCSEGSGCDSKKAMTAPVVAAIAVSADERNEVQAQLVQFASDVDMAEQKESQDRAKNYAAAAAANACFAAGLTWDPQNLKCVQIADPTHQSFKNIPEASFKIQLWRQERLAPLLHRWDEYQKLAATPLVTPTVASFEQIKADFQELVKEWTQNLGQKTSAVPPPVATKGFTDSFGEGLGKAAGIIGQVGTYAVVLGGIGLVLYFVGPAAAAWLASRKASK